MKHFVLCFFAAATVSSLPASELTSAVLKDAAVSPRSNSNIPNSIDGMPLLNSSLTVNGNVAIALNDNRQINCNNQQSNTRPKVPDGYVIISEDDEYITAIKYHPTGETWNDARRICFFEGGFLAYPESREEENFYLNMMNSIYINDLWIGVHDFFATGDFSTILGEVAVFKAYLTWLPGEPNNDQGPEPCTHYRRVNGQLGLNDRTCLFKYAFNCKIKLRKNNYSSNQNDDYEA